MDKCGVIEIHHADSTKNAEYCFNQCNKFKLHVCDCITT